LSDGPKSGAANSEAGYYPQGIPAQGLFPHPKRSNFIG
jgi:hypothetical protein